MSVGVASPSPARGQGNVASKYRRQWDRERTYERLVERENEDDGGEDFDDDRDFRGGGGGSKDEENGNVKARRRRGRSGNVDGDGDEDGKNDKHDDDEKDYRIARLMEQVERLTEKVEDLVGVVAGQMEREGLDEEDVGEEEEPEERVDD